MFRLKSGVWLRALLDPIRRDDRLIVPAPLLQVKFPDAREVTSRDTKRDSRMPRQPGLQPFKDVTRLEVLHSERFCKPVLERLFHWLTRKLFERRANNVEIPVVVIPLHSRLGRVATWPAPGIGWCLVGTWMIDARAGSQKLFEGGAQFHVVEWIDIVDLQLSEARVNVKGLEKVCRTDRGVIERV